MVTELAEKQDLATEAQDGVEQTDTATLETEAGKAGQNVEPETKEAAKTGDNEQPSGNDGDEIVEPDYTNTLKSLDKVEVTDARKAAFREAPLDEAFRTLQREGLLPKSQLEDWAVNDPEGFVAAGIKAAAKQTNFDRLGNKLHELESKATDKTQTEKSEPDGEADALDDVWSELQEEYGDKITKLKDQWTERETKIVEAFESKLSKAQEFNDYIAERLERRELAEYRQALMETYPDLADADNYEKVVERTKRYVRDGGYTDLEEAFNDATARELSPLSVKHLQQRMTQRAGKRKAGQPFTGTKPQDQNRQTTSEDRDKAAFAELQRKHMAKR